MKSTTLRRSNITREKIAMLEALNKYHEMHKSDVYYDAQIKTKELDALWENFGLKNQRTEKTPQVYFITGLVCGVIITLIITTFISLLINVVSPKDEGIIPTKKSSTVTSTKFSFIPADNSIEKNKQKTSVLNEEYVVREGDTLENIIIRFYGTFDLSKVALIQEANKMANPNALSIGQKLIIPMNQ